MLRSLVIGQIGCAGHKAVIDEAKKRFAAHCDGSAELPADLRLAVSSCLSNFLFKGVGTGAPKITKSATFAWLCVVIYNSIC